MRKNSVFKVHCFLPPSIDCHFQSVSVILLFKFYKAYKKENLHNLVPIKL